MERNRPDTEPAPLPPKNQTLPTFPLPPDLPMADDHTQSVNSPLSDLPADQNLPRSAGLVLSLQVWVLCKF